MIGTRGLDPEAGDSLRLTRGQLRHRREPGAAKEFPGSRGAEHRDLAVEAPQGAAVGVVEVQMGDEDGVDALDDLGGRIAALPAEGAEPPAQHRIGEQPLAFQLDQHSRVAHVGDAIAHRAPGCGPLFLRA